MTSPPWGHISSGAKAVVRGLLTVDPKKRWTAAKVLAHPWMSPTDGACHLNLACTDVVFDSMRGGDAAEKARRAVATALATDLAPDAVDGLRESLVAADADGDGRVSVDDLRNALRKAGSTATAKLVAKLLAGQASGGGGWGGIEYDTLLGATRRMASIVPTTAARAA